jgi:hypothetical protein
MEYLPYISASIHQVEYLLLQKLLILMGLMFHIIY